MYKKIKRRVGGARYSADRVPEDLAQWFASGGNTDMIPWCALLRPSHVLLLDWWRIWRKADSKTVAPGYVKIQLAAAFSTGTEGGHACF